MPLRPDIIQTLRDEGAPIVILTGAGISRESGLHTFRDPDGIWARYDISEVATPEAFATNPDLVHHFYNDRRRALTDPAILPNAAHHALARLERDWPGDVLLVTQNVDDLHDRAGSQNLIHMHGELLKIRCLQCGQQHHWPGDLGRDEACPSCRHVAGLRPDIVWFGEMPREMDRIDRALTDCGLFVSIGTSGTVYPAAGFVQIAAQAGAETIELNLEPGHGTTAFDYCQYGPATLLVPGFVDQLLAK
ncbi:NAD-dependent deacylase [Thalassospira sp.]|uniref:NAD-dependent deacylase n=1 Tax=Thalassospira sp. TaxID=1912094 RepID=UPI00273710BD|nr:NAD-dependent deacylase [Thalassospira sp.]MDP2699203.1 NAD-dependent deacylase [Thalassospira sp.]